VRAAALDFTEARALEFREVNELDAGVRGMILVVEACMSPFTGFVTGAV
jgi:hypothetical protein